MKHKDSISNVRYCSTSCKLYKVSQQCPLCSQLAGISGLANGRDGFIVSCTACGEFEITGTLFVVMAGVDAKRRLFLSCHTRQQNDMGTREILTTANWKSLVVKHQHGDAKVQQALLLQLLRKRTPMLGENAKIDLLNDYPLIDAITKATLAALLQDLEHRGHIKDLTLDGSCCLTVEGWEAAGKAVAAVVGPPGRVPGPGRLFDVAISFAGSERDVARRIAQKIRAAGVSVFFDEFVAHELWGKDLAEEFGAAYLERSQFCVMLVSQQYVTRDWPRHERRHALARALRERAEYVLPVRFGSVEVPGLPPTIGYLEFDRYGVEGICELLLRKLGRNGVTSPPTNPDHKLGVNGDPRPDGEGMFPIYEDDLSHFAETLEHEGFDAKVNFYNGQVGLVVGPRGLDVGSLQPNVAALFFPLWEINATRNRTLVMKRDFQGIVEFRPGDWRFDRPYLD